MKVSLPQESWASLKDKDEISERVAREIIRAAIDAGAVTDKLTNAGFDDEKLDTYHLVSELTDQEQHNLNAFQTVLIRSVVSSWSFDEAITDDSIEDLPKPIYDALAMECLSAWKGPEKLDPKADTDA